MVVDYRIFFSKAKEWVRKQSKSRDSFFEGEKLFPSFFLKRRKQLTNGKGELVQKGRNKKKSTEHCINEPYAMYIYNLW